MRKAIFAIVALVATFACSKVEKETPMTTVTFKVGHITSGIMETKATFTQMLRDIQPLSQPTLTLTSTTNTAYEVTVTAGQSITLPVGSYDVTAQYRESIIGSVGGYPVSEEPMYCINETVTVKSGTTIVYLTGIYECWALGINYLDTSYYLMDGQRYNMVNDDIGEKGVLFISTIESGIPWNLIVYPKDNTLYEPKTFQIADNTAGCWYCYSAGLKETQAGVFVVNLPDWQEAN